MYFKSKYHCKGRNCEFTWVVLHAIIFLFPACNMIFCKSSSGISNNNIWESAVLRKLLKAEEGTNTSEPKNSNILVLLTIM